VTNKHIRFIGRQFFAETFSKIPNTDDDITPKEQVFNAENYLGTPKDKIVKDLAEGGHIGLFMGRKAIEHNWRKIADWILAH
jgi:poly(3-hydroxyalkanoate) synthetase